jgi:Reverse transcriptase (RNA-dependent DNA polymerase)
MNIILRYKARLVAQGFFPNYLEYIPNDTYSQVAKSVSISIFLPYQFHLEIIHIMDVDTVFLNADMDENIWVKIPEGTNLAAHDDGIHKLWKSLYGLKQAFSNWNNDINQHLIDNDITNKKLIRETMSRTLRLVRVMAQLSSNISW